MITDIARGEADLDTLKAGASLIPMAKITKVPKVVKAIGNVGKTGLKKGKEGEKIAKSSQAKQTKARDKEGSGTLKGVCEKATKGYDVKPKYSSYEERVKNTPKNQGKWSNNQRGESTFISDKSGEVRKYLDEAGVSGVEYKNGIPDFSPFSKGEVRLRNMTNDRKANFSSADEMLAEKWSTPEKKWTAEDIAYWREDNKYTWHELNDLETIQLVPSKINSIFKHLGGVGEYNIKIKLGE